MSVVVAAAGAVFSLALPVTGNAIEIALAVSAGLLLVGMLLGTLTAMFRSVANRRPRRVAAFPAYPDAPGSRPDPQRTYVEYEEIIVVPDEGEEVIVVVPEHIVEGALETPPGFAVDLNEKRASRNSIFAELTMLHFLTFIMLIAALWVILSNKYKDDTQKWAFGVVGTVLGFWFSPKGG